MFKGGFLMGSVTITGAMIIITGWLVLVEFDSYPEQERRRILDKIKTSPSYILLIALMPIGILMNIIGAFFGIVWMVVLGAALIFLQAIIISLLLWNRKRWKSVLLLIAIAILATVS